MDPLPLPRRMDPEPPPVLRMKRGNPPLLAKGQGGLHRVGAPADTHDARGSRAEREDESQARAGGAGPREEEPHRHRKLPPPLGRNPNSRFVATLFCDFGSGRARLRSQEEEID